MAEASQPSASATGDAAGAPATIAPLTGRKAEKETVGRSSVAVALAGRSPQGLDRADIVYEEFSDQPRWLALYQSENATAGPVTAARPMDPMMLSVLRPIYAYAGGPAGVLSQVDGSEVNGVDAGDGSDAFDGSRVSTSALRKEFHRMPAAVPLLSYASETADPPPGMRRISKIVLKVPGYSTQTWSYDAKVGGWRLPAVDGLVPANLVVQFVEYKQIQVKHPNGPFVPSARVFGTGRAVVASQDQALDGMWRKAGVQALTTYSTARGVLARMTPGPTVILLAPRSARVTLR